MSIHITIKIGALIRKYSNNKLYLQINIQYNKQG
jgi:hypothetical protein